MNLYKTTYIFFLCIIGIAGVFLLVTMIPIPGNFEVRVVQSGSMEPAISTGSIVVIKPSAEYKVGDVITFADTTSNMPTTHRVVAIEMIHNVVHFTTKGDANDGNDMGKIPQERVIGKVVIHLPYVGYLLDAAQKPIGFVLLIVLPAIIIISEEFSRIWKEIKKIQNKKKETQDVNTSEIEI